MNKKAALLRKDRVTRVLTADGRMRVAAVKNSQCARNAQQRHELDAASAAILAQALAAATLLASFMKGEERVIVEASGAGAVQNVLAEAIQVGEVRGYVHHRGVEGAAQDRRAPPLIGPGRFKVSRILYDHPAPSVGIVELASGDFAEQFGSYLSQSEQIPSAVRFEVTQDQDGNIVESAGVLVQVMPGWESTDPGLLQDMVAAVPSLCEVLAVERPAALLERVVAAPFTILADKRVDFFCRCSLQRFTRALTALPLGDLEDMRKLGQNELVCHFCNARYTISDSDFDHLIERIRKSAASVTN
ncbi:MAG: Hsp33 family molecular chaperone HslO [Candidatus Schekmanbacteria bacterium]|nr:Hsp33 family molecular chaperone HslO [Candidatus Schekmanbacteria bacterium]